MPRSKPFTYKMAGPVKSGEPSWKWRRILIFATVVWSFFQLAMLVNGPDTRVNDTIAFGLLVLISTLVLGYTGLATAQDIAAIWTTRTARPYSEPPQEPTPPPPGDQTIVVAPVVPRGPAMPEPQ